MKTIKFNTPFNYSLSRYSGWTREHYEELFCFLMRGIIKNSSPAGARQRIPGQRSHHGLLADELEGFTRAFIMAGPWLSQSKEGKFDLEGTSYDVGHFYRQGILAGTDPEHDEYWGDIYDYAQ
ncbi:MAG TPA: DUF2264 domain-containing protein, partial [Spirochaetota bacterium]|nr:DUF2264 domain-containing protein [Spirochaetota bacterium]